MQWAMTMDPYSMEWLTALQTLHNWSFLIPNSQANMGINLVLWGLLRSLPVRRSKNSSELESYLILVHPKRRLGNTNAHFSTKRCAACSSIAVKQPDSTAWWTQPARLHHTWPWASARHEGHLQNLVDEVPHILSKQLADDCKKLINTDLKKEKTGADYRLVALHLLCLLCTKNAPVKVILLLASIVSISELLYANDLQRTPKMFLRLYNLTWLHFGLCTELFTTTIR